MVRTDTRLIDRAGELAAVFRGEAAANEAGGRLTDATVQALRSGDFFGLLVPACFGGAEAKPLEALQIYETISAADASAGWVLMACNVGTGSAAGYLPAEGAHEVFGKRIPVICGEGAPKGRADVEGKGFQSRNYRSCRGVYLRPQGRGRGGVAARCSAAMLSRHVHCHAASNRFGLHASRMRS